MSSLKDDTPEGKSIVELGNKLGSTIDKKKYENIRFYRIYSTNKNEWNRS